MDNTQAEISLLEEIPLILAATDAQGNIIPNAVISDVQWSVDASIGEIIPDMEVPNKATFVPSKSGTVHISATAVITVP